MRRIALVWLTLTLAACQRSPEATSPTNGSGVGEPSATVGAAPTEAAVETEPIEEETAALWIGLYCETAEPERTFSFYVDGSERQRVDCRCEGEIGKHVPPNCGQFVLDVPVGVRTLRMQDDTGDVHAEQDVGITSERWITISHREVGAGSGFLTSFDEWQRAPRFAVSD